MRRTPTRTRKGFTLIEMMVTVALTLFIMVILSTAFSSALETFRQLKAIGDMQDELRTASNMLRSDLAADHFEGKRRLSDATFWTIGSPREGFLRITQSATPAVDPLAEGKDADGLPSRRRVDHVLHFTVKRRGNRPSEFFTAPVPATSPLQGGLFPNPDGRFQDPVFNAAANSITYPLYNSQWAEVIYFLYPAMTASGVQATANGTPLYGLYRQQRVVIPDPTVLNTAGNQINYTNLLPADKLAYLNQFSCQVINDPTPATAAPKKLLYFNSPSALTIPDRRLQRDATTNLYLPRKDVNGLPTGDDLVMTNVISFDVQALMIAPNGQTGVGDMIAPNYVFDTWSNMQDELYNYSDLSVTGTPIPMPGYTVLGLQITLRVWDSRTQQTRQITLFQEM
jgi:prepilin-type N-terminal cleavage/methylation domain-containing protein